VPVTKQTYTLNAGYTRANMADAMRSAFIDAGLMTEWHDSFTISSGVMSGSPCRVMEIPHDATKAYGTAFYYFVFDTGVYVALATGWRKTGTAPLQVPDGTQYLDYFVLPAGISNISSQLTRFGPTFSTTSNLFLDRFTSGEDPKQSWFLFRQPANLTRSSPFSFLHKDTTLHPWLDLSKGCISGLSTVETATSNRAGYTFFAIPQALRRCLSFGSALRDSADGADYSAMNIYPYSYVGAGSASNQGSSNLRGWNNAGARIPVPIGRNYVNSAFASDYVPIISNIPWNYYTPTRLANDLGVYMNYASNSIALGDRFIVQSAINEWEVLNFANNTVLTDGASATFLARIT
jgi:hypothetical protein